MLLLLSCSEIDRSREVTNHPVEVAGLVLRRLQLLCAPPQTASYRHHIETKGHIHNETKCMST